MITLSNGAKIYNFGRPKLFLMGGVHGEERAPVMALMTIIKDDLKDVWVLPCLNIQGHKELNRFCGDKNLNGEFKGDTTIDFMLELMEILKNNIPDTFVDLHEDVNSSNDYIWSDFDNDDAKVRVYCERHKVGLIYQPDIDEYYYSTVGTSQSFAREIGVKNCYTTETAQYAPFDKRLKANKNYIKLFMGV